MIMRQTVRGYIVLSGFILILLAAALASAQQSKPGVLSADEIKKVVPATYFFRGQSASVQLRNSSGFRGLEGKLILVGLVDTGGYATDVQEKYQGFLITEVKLKIEDSELAPGQYGFGFSKNGKFTVLDVGANDLLAVSSHSDSGLHRPTPLKIVEDGTGYRLYEGRNWVSLKAQ
jgi:hypothetical protein